MGFEHRLEAELELLRAYYPELEYKQEGGHWMRIAAYPLSEGWSQDESAVAFEVKDSHPGTPPYGIYVPADLTFGGQLPNNRNASPPAPPFDGAWALLSWTPADGEWRATAELRTGSNLLQWVRGFADRFAQGR